MVGNVISISDWLDTCVPRSFSPYMIMEKSHKSHDALHKYPTTCYPVRVMCTRVHISVIKLCIVRPCTGASWGLMPQVYRRTTDGYGIIKLCMCGMCFRPIFGNQTSCCNQKGNFVWQLFLSLFFFQLIYIYIYVFVGYNYSPMP